jgi:hypothetical protein
MEKTKDLTMAEVRAMYFDTDALILSPIRLFRYQSGGNRFYFYLDKIMNGPGPEPKEVVKLAIGTTTLASATIPTGDFLIKWYAQNGWDASIAIRDEKSKYGSLMHTCDAELHIKRTFDLDLIPEIVAGYMKKNKLTHNIEQWSVDLKSDILAMAQFIRDYNVKPLAIELSLVSTELGVAGTLDLFCEMDDEESGFFGEVYKSGDKKGQPKETKRIVRTLAIVDFKSGRKTSENPHHVAQLVILRILLNDTMKTVYGVDIHASKIKLYNWHPKEWQTNPSYTLIDQTDKIPVSDDEYVNGLVWHYRVHNADPSFRRSVETSGIVNVDIGFESNVSVKTILEIAESRINSGDEIPSMKYDSVDDYLKTESDEPELVWNEVDENPVEIIQNTES